MCSYIWLRVAEPARDPRYDDLSRRVDNQSLMLRLLCNDKGIDPTSHPEFCHPPSPHRSLSPSIQSTTSPSVPLAKLTLSESQSHGSVRSSAGSDLPPQACEYCEAIPFGHSITSLFTAQGSHTSSSRGQSGGPGSGNSRASSAGGA